MFVECRIFLSPSGSIPRLTFSQRTTNTTAGPWSPSAGGLNHLIARTHTHTRECFLCTTVVTSDYSLQPTEASQKRVKQMSATFTMTITTIKKKLKWVFLESRDAENISRQNHKFHRSVLKPQPPRTLNNSQTRLSDRIFFQISTSQWKENAVFSRSEKRATTSNK